MQRFFLGIKNDKRGRNIIRGYVASNKGFTLIELLVVIAIIGTLSTIGFIALTSSTDSANDTVKISEMRSLQSAIQIKSATSGTSKFPGGANACGKLDSASNTLDTVLGNETTGIDFGNDDYFYCANGTAGDIDATWYVIGSLNIKNADVAALKSDLDQAEVVAGTTTGVDFTTITALGGRTIKAAEACQDVTTGTGTTHGGIFCLGVI